MPEQSVEKLLVEASTQDAELEGWKARCRELEKTVRDQRTILDTYRDDDDDEGGGGGASDENYGRVAGQLERKNAKLERQSELVGRLSADKAALKKAVTELKNEVARLNKKVEQGGEREDALEVKIEAMRKEGKEILAEKKEVSKELTARKREVESLKKKLQTSEKKVKKIEENLAATQEESNEWKEKSHKAFKAGKTEVTANKKMIAELTREVQQREKEVAAEGKTIERLENNLELMNKRLQKAKDKRTPCELCTNQMWAAALHLTLQACEDRDDGRDVSLSVLHRTIKDVAKKFPEIERNREAGRNFITKVPHYFEQKPAPDESSDNHASASGEAALSGGLCAMCSNEEVIQALYWVIEACQYPEQSSWWHPELTKHMYAWHSAYSGLIERCLAGCNAVRPIDMSDDEDENEQQNDGDEEPYPPLEKTMEEKIREKYYHYYVLLVRVQQTVQVFEDAGMPLAELGGAYKNLKAELDRRKENGTSLSAMQDRLDLGQAYLEEQVAYWAKDRSVVSGDTIDYTPLAVGLPEKLQALREELEEKKREVSGILARASDAQADAKEGIPYAQFKSEMETFADPLRERYGAPEMLPGIPVKRPDWILPPTDMQPDSHGKTGQVSTGVKLDDIVEEGGGEAVREGSLGSSSMEIEELPFDPPDSVSIYDFLFDENFGRHPLGYSHAPFTCGMTGKEYSALDVKDRVEALARGLSKELGWKPNHGTEWDKVIGVFSVNTIDTLTLAWATHRLGGVQTPANAAYSAPEIEYQLKDSGAKCLFTCLPLLPTALEACSKAGIPKNRIYILDVPKELTGGKSAPSEYKTVDQLIQDGLDAPALEKLHWAEGEGARRTAFLCYSSGTSGLPKGVMISHRNVIANTLQIKTFDKSCRDKKIPPGTQSDYTETALGLLPMSHIYCLVVICHASVYRGDRVVVLPKFEFKPYLEAIQRFKINCLYLVPPIIIMMTKQKQICDQYDLSSIDAVFTGAAPLGEETAVELSQAYPKWVIRQGYGLTETSTVVCSTIDHDVWFGSSGSILPGIECKLVTLEGNEITGYDQPGELLVKSPAVTLGYHNKPDATKETFHDGWMRTGDEAVVRKSPLGFEHIFIVDRIKELIKVKGLQVAPAELEAHLLSHPYVNDCAVIPVPDDRAGEVPKAFIVKSPKVGLEESDRMVARTIEKHVEEHKSRHKWLKGGVEFIDVIPKSPSGKILRRLLRDKEKEKRRAAGAKL
ncbi:putative phenylacetyl- ligase [Diplodia seriata]|uniref:Putative phenylacetyl-ligase n=1 Tax=Diplodia seriata TaxID=420778 RepID=A0A0G2HJG5_9PEZI|nr:putative phenylacetyl- ligase [Diplodia seriata]